MPISRRQFLQDAGFCTAALSLSPLEVAALPTQAFERRGRTKTVIVVGAGLAGLAAAYELTKAGHDVTVLETRLQPGGRVRTLREPFSDGLYAEAGARIFSDSYVRLIRYANELAVPFAPLSASPFAPLYHLRGERLAARTGEPVDWPYDLTTEEQQLGPGGILGKHILPVVQQIGDPAAPGWQLGAAQQYDRMTFTEFLRRQGASDEAVELVRRTYWGGPGADTTSAQQYFVAYLATFSLGQAFYAFPGGNDRLPRALADRLRDRIHYGATVARINHGPNGVEAVVQQGSASHTVAAEHLICAVPFSHLRHMEVSPSLPPQEARLIEELDYAAVVRVYLQVRRRFWEREQVTGSAYTDLPVMEVSEQPFLPPAAPTPRGILEALVQGPEARRLAEMTESQRIESVLEHMERVHPGLAEHVEGGASKFWGHGAYSQFRPGELTEWLPRVARPDSRLHFAGEHTSVLAGTMEGALESGQRAAQEVNLAR